MPRGGFHGGFRGGGFGRRYGPPLIGMGGMGMGMGSPLLTSLIAGGIGYLFGSNANRQDPAQLQQVMPVPVYTQPPVQPYTSAQELPPIPVPPASTSSDTLAQLKLLGELHASGVLTDEEFAREKSRILNR